MRCACIFLSCCCCFFNPETSKHGLVVRAVANVHEKKKIMMMMITEAIPMIKFSSSVIGVLAMAKMKKKKSLSLSDTT